MTLQEKLATRLYELLPHKKELEFGCEIFNKTLNQKLVVTHFSSNNECINCYYYGESNTTWIWKKYLDDTFEIIGQPLRLADLLMAIEKVLDDNHICYVNSVGAVYVLDMNKSYQKQFEDTNYGEYNLSKDNILDQSDEFCEFVLELLK